MTNTTVTIEETAVSFVVLIDRHDGQGPQLSASYPSGSRAGYPEARERLRAEALRKADDRVAFLTLSRADYDARSKVS